MFLHNDKELFEDIILATSEYLHLPIAIIEKDYYVTMILKLLAEDAPFCVFKGGTSLSKAHHIIHRFSEDIDISFTKNLTQGEKRKLKHNIIANISKRLQLPISDWEYTRSRRDYNCYTFKYLPLEGFVQNSLLPGVKMEISLLTPSFPTINLFLDSYIYHFLKIDNYEIIEKYNLHPFKMNVQSIERTFIDKVFALCDYYLASNTFRHSRHIYDIYMLLPFIKFNNELKNLIEEIRKQRSQIQHCLSANNEIIISEILNKIIIEKTYKLDYEEITTYFQNFPVKYEVAIEALKVIINSNTF